MIMLENLGSYRKGRLWVKNMPRINYTVIDQIYSTLPVEKGLVLSPCNLALETLFSPRQVSNYAFLGVNFTPNDGEIIEITINTSLDEGRILEDHIAFQSDEVYMGIPYEYGEAILSSVQETLLDIQTFSGGKLNFHMGAYGQVGTSQRSFSKTTEIMIRLLTINPYIADEKQLEEMILESL
ncbi:hypothetical protein [Hazenella coriacea]|uniref:Uncharacterized protein n=1 Tax=Hazenella coriacea TaxID=1179467 RepID=A0A4R3LAJ6_9BACL|nr:hypothetical protein [Hazenella coriacea]TCS96769.1 hypothetical protein EDD58_101410 [Hazenella coriacea]